MKTLPLVNVQVSSHDDQYHLVTYLVGDTKVMDLTLSKEHVPISDYSNPPLLVLTQIFVTPHAHLNLLGEWLSHAKEMDPSSTPLGAVRWNDLISRTELILSGPSEEKDSLISE
tara:strand:+ start:2941 stop:3282 length:342 start_codon:yes stop_codon:yes gene_type:complete